MTDLEMIDAALKEADRLNEIVGPMARAYHDQMRILAKQAKRPLFVVYPGHGEIVIQPRKNYLPARDRAATAWWRQQMRDMKK